MIEPKPVASLTASLLVRKGQARPALRPGLMLDTDDPEADGREIHMGHSEMQMSRAERVIEWLPRGGPTMPEPAPAPTPAPTPVQAAPAPVHIMPKPVQPAAEVVQMPRRGVRERAGATSAAAGARDRVSFTLRLDTERHTQLRVLAAQRRVSAQTVVIDALDHYLACLKAGVEPGAFAVKTSQNS